MPVFVTAAVITPVFVNVPVFDTVVCVILAELVTSPVRFVAPVPVIALVIAPP